MKAKAKAKVVSGGSSNMAEDITEIVLAMVAAIAKLAMSVQTVIAGHRNSSSNSGSNSHSNNQTYNVSTNCYCRPHHDAEGSIRHMLEPCLWGRIQTGGSVWDRKAAQFPGMGLGPELLMPAALSEAEASQVKSTK